MRALMPTASVMALLVAASLMAAETPLPPSIPGQTNYDELAAFGEAVQRVDDYRDNQYLYNARVHELLQRSLAFENAKIEFTVAVERVTLEEVFVRVEDAGVTRVLLHHAQPPAFGNLRTVFYSGPPSTLFYNQFAKPVALRIGSEIPLEMAARLRKRDLLVIQAQVGCMRAIIGPTYRPQSIATMTNWTVLRADPAADNHASSAATPSATIR